MQKQAKDLAAVFKKSAKDGVLEKPFRASVEKHLIELGQAEGIELVPHTEVTMGSSGRADTIYNRFIVEWKQPGLFSSSNNATANSKAIAQLKGYVETFWFSNRQKPGRVVGCCTDGRYFIFATKPDRDWHVSDPVPVDEQTCRKFLDYFLSLHSGIALLPEYLAEDFSAENVRTQRTVKALYQSLEKHADSPSLEAIFGQWAAFFGAVTEYEQWRVKLANEAELRKTVKAFGIPEGKLDLNRFFFATHTFFAILTKLLAYVIVGRYTDLPTPPLEEWKNLTNDKLAEHFAALEKGGPFHAAGIRNFLEGDFFAWYEKFMRSEMWGVSYFYALEQNPGRDGYHVHALWCDCLNKERREIWRTWFERYGRARIEPVNSRDDVADYCAKYVAKDGAWWNVKLLGQRHPDFADFKLSSD